MSTRSYIYPKPLPLYGDNLKTQTDKKSETVSQEIVNEDPIIIVGECEGTYINEAVTKEFSGKLLLTARPDGCVIVHDLNAGVRPICYMHEADVSVSQDGGEINVIATCEPECMELTFSEVIAAVGMSEEVMGVVQ